MGRHKDLFNALKVGETIECGIRHGQKAADILPSTDLLKKIADALPNGEEK
jgi:hypothetical protein